MKARRLLKAQYGTCQGWNPLFIPVYANYVVSTQSLSAHQRSRAQLSASERPAE